MKLIILLLTPILCAACTISTYSPSPPPNLPNGIAAGDVTQESAILWARSTVTGPITFTYGMDLTIDPVEVSQFVSDPLVPVTVTVVGLAAGHQYHYQVETATGDTLRGHFRTPAAPGTRRGLRFGVSGDWRADLRPFPAIANAPARDLDFFVELGDTIYADFRSPAVPQQARTLEEFRLKHAENYDTVLGVNTLAALRSSTAILATIDDHEVLNDVAGGMQAADTRLFAETEGYVNQARTFVNALTAFLEYNPLRRDSYGVSGDPRMDGRPKLYRYRHFGDDAAVFVLDTRSFRDAGLTPVDFANPADRERFLREAFTPGRTLLGQQQFRDLQRDLLDAHARGVTWKFVIISMPIQNRGLPAAQDRYEGYAAERAQLLRFIDENQIANVVFIAADIHGTIVNNLTYQEDVGQPQIATDIFEVTTGSVAFHAPFGPTVINAGVQRGEITEEELQQYNRLPVRADTDAVADDKDDFVRAWIDEHLDSLGYDAIGLDGSSIRATLLQGDYTAVHTYGWTEFDVEAETQALTVTTYGIPYYAPSEIGNTPSASLTRSPGIVSQFVVQP